MAAVKLPEGWDLKRERYSVYVRTRHTRDRDGRAVLTDVFRHPMLWTLTEPDGTVRVFDTRGDALEFLAHYR